MAVTDLLRPDEVRGLRSDVVLLADIDWPYEQLEQLCYDYLALWHRCEQLEQDAGKLSRREVDDD